MQNHRRVQIIEGVATSMISFPHKKSQPFVGRSLGHWVYLSNFEMTQYIRLILKEIFELTFSAVQQHKYFCIQLEILVSSFLHLLFSFQGIHSRFWAFHSVLLDSRHWQNTLLIFCIAGSIFFLFVTISYISFFM